MQFIQGNNRHQTYFSTLEDQVSADNPVRLMDAFIDKLDLQKLGFNKTIHKSEGRPPYAAAVLLKLYLYGYLNKIRSSRKLNHFPPLLVFFTNNINHLRVLISGAKFWLPRIHE